MFVLVSHAKTAKRNQMKLGMEVAYSLHLHIGFFKRENLQLLRDCGWSCGVQLVGNICLNVTGHTDIVIYELVIPILSHIIWTI